MRSDVLGRHSLLVRLVAASVVIAVSSIVATAWLAVRGTSSAIERAQGQHLSGDATIYDTLLGYAASHSSWAGVESVVSGLSERTGRQITLTTQRRQTIARSPDNQDPLPAKASAAVDPLHTDPQLKPGSASRIDSRAVGPYRLDAKDSKELRTTMAGVQRCVAQRGDYRTELAEAPSGRTDVVLANPTDAGNVALTECRSASLAGTLALSEIKALGALESLVGDCLKRRGLSPVFLTISFAWLHRKKDGRTDDAAAQDCVDAGRRDQLKAYVAPPALLFVRSADGSGNPFDLSRANLTRVALVTGLILAVTVALTVLMAVRLVRPLRALTTAARHPATENARVEVSGRDEIGVLAEAFNDLSDRRQRAEEQRQAMVRDIAHELRTPLTNIRAWLEASEDGLAGLSSDPALASALLREALQLQHMIEDLQDLAAGDAGELRLRPEPTDVKDLAGQVTTAHQSSAEAAGVALRSEITGDPVLVADPARLQQALGNLVTNALRYTPRGGVVTVSARDDGPDVLIEVADTGTGIDDADLPNVFERFWRADKSRTRDTGGSGLGLAIVQQIAAMHGGTVSVVSPAGEGTRFTLRIPRDPQSEAPPV